LEFFENIEMIAGNVWFLVFITFLNNNIAIAVEVFDNSLLKKFIINFFELLSY